MAVFAESPEARCQLENEDVVGAAPTGDAPTTSEWSTVLLPTKVQLILEVSRYVVMNELCTWWTPVHFAFVYFSSYIRTDVIRRILENHFNIDTVFVMGVTDIDDKIIKRAKEVRTGPTGINPLAPGDTSNFELMIFKLISMTDILSICEIALRRMPQDPTDNQSKLLQVNGLLLSGQQAII